MLIFLKKLKQHYIDKNILKKQEFFNPSFTLDCTDESRFLKVAPIITIFS